MSDMEKDIELVQLVELSGEYGLFESLGRDLDDDEDAGLTAVVLEIKIDPSDSNDNSAIVRLLVTVSDDDEEPQPDVPPQSKPPFAASVGFLIRLSRKWDRSADGQNIAEILWPALRSEIAGHAARLGFPMLQRLPAVYPSESASPA